MHHKVYIKSKKQVTKWCDTYTELVDIADRLDRAGVMVEVQTRGRAPNYQYAIFRLYPKVNKRRLAVV